MSFGKYFFFPFFFFRGRSGAATEKAFLLFHIFIRFNEFLLPKFCNINGSWSILHFVAFWQSFSHTFYFTFSHSWGWGEIVKEESFLVVWRLSQVLIIFHGGSQFGTVISTRFESELNNKFSKHCDEKFIRFWKIRKFRLRMRGENNRTRMRSWIFRKTKSEKIFLLIFLFF